MTALPSTPALQRCAWLVAGLASCAVASYFGLRFAYAPRLDGELTLPGLGARVVVDTDALGTPTIRAQSQLDALRALGFLSARDRLFQMDLLRRSSAGELAQIFGPELVEADVQKRHLGLARVARAIVEHLPSAQRAALAAYTEGVNTYVESAALLPLEFWLLGYRPARWRAQDSMLVVLGMFHVLNGSEELERTRTLLMRALPANLAQFVLASPDPYNERLLHDGFPAPAAAGAGRDVRPQSGEGVQAETPSSPQRGVFAAANGADGRARRLQAAAHAVTEPVLRARAGEARAGSNAWAVSGARTRDGRAIVANDMHLDLAVPNVWYRAELRYGEHKLSGLVLPGVPLLVAGSNGQVAWGLTNLEGDVLDLVALELHPERSNEYRTPSGWQPFIARSESVKVRGEPDRQVRVRTTIWGPVAPRALLGQPVAVRWSALDPEAVDLGLLEMARAQSVEDAMAVLNRAAMPPLNAIVADQRGQIGWTITGRIPRRRGFDGAHSVSWADGRAGWEGYVEPTLLPRLLDPSTGFLVNANQRMPERPGDPSLGHDFGNGYRAYRVAERLAALPRATERELLALQLDTHSALFGVYRDVARAALAAARERELTSVFGAGQAGAALRDEVGRALAAWDGRAEVSSLGFALIARFRRLLAEQVYAGWFAACREAEPAAELDLADLDTPLARALTQGPAELFAFARGGRDALVLGTLAQAARELKQAHGSRALDTLAWGEVSRVHIEHPLGVLPGLGWGLNMPTAPLAGCGFCVRMASGTLGASERFVVSPGHEADGVLHMPAGQSGSVFSPHYDDQQRAWVEGRALPFAPGPARHTLTLLPARAGLSAARADASSARATVFRIK